MQQENKRLSTLFMGFGFLIMLLCLVAAYAPTNTGNIKQKEASVKDIVTTMQSQDGYYTDGVSELQQLIDNGTRIMVDGYIIKDAESVDWKDIKRIEGEGLDKRYYCFTS